MATVCIRVPRSHRGRDERHRWVRLGPGRALIWFLIWSAARSAGAAEVTNIPQVGTHQRLFVFKKNENPENVMIVYTKVTSDCRIVSDADHRPVFDFYWLMGGVDFKPVHPLIESGIRDRLQIQPGSITDGNAAAKTFSVEVEDLKEVSSDVESPELVVRSRRVNKGCAVDGSMRLGPSDGRLTLRLDEIDSQVEETVLPPFRRPVSITLKGINVKTGKAVSRTYRTP